MLYVKEEFEFADISLKTAHIAKSCICYFIVVQGFCIQPLLQDAFKNVFTTVLLSCIMKSYVQSTYNTIKVAEFTLKPDSLQVSLYTYMYT